jgi:hypothetical protein
MVETVIGPFCTAFWRRLLFRVLQTTAAIGIHTKEVMTLLLSDFDEFVATGKTELEKMIQLLPECVN